MLFLNPLFLGDQITFANLSHWEIRRTCGEELLEDSVTEPWNWMTSQGQDGHSSTVTPDSLTYTCGPGVTNTDPIDFLKWLCLVNDKLN